MELARIDVEAPVTAVAFSPSGRLPATDDSAQSHRWWLAIGLETGRLELRAVTVARDRGIVVHADTSAVVSCSHADAVRALAWRPDVAAGGHPTLASGGDDHVVRVWSLITQEAASHADEEK